MKHIQKIALFLAGSFLLSSCSKDDDRDDSGTISTDVAVQDFVWKGMNSWYYWQKDVPMLADAVQNNTKDYQNLLKGKKPDELFYSLLYNYPTTDRYSWIVENVDDLLQSFSGVSKSSGFDFTAFYKDTGNTNLVAIVNYVIPNSPADKAGVKRGDVISSVNGGTLTVNNYLKLLDEQFSFTVSENVEVTTSGIVTSGNQKSISIQSVTIEENPVAFYKTLSYDAKKVGYLVYNGFQSNYNDELNDAFGKMKQEGVTDLVLDLRYNGGGSVASAIALGQMITGQFTGKNFVSMEFNSKHSQYSSMDKLTEKVPIYNFVNGQNQKSGEQNANSLNLTKVYVLTSSGTASASELTISGLDPYIDVVTIGGETYGKFVGSITLFDDPKSDFTDYENRNKAHKWAMQPITFAYYNANKDPHPAKGIVPNFPVNSYSYFGTLKEFGNPSDPALSKALELIVGRKVGKMVSPITAFEKEKSFVNSSKTLKRYGTEVYIEGFKAKN